MGNREAKELRCMTHGHELRGRDTVGRIKGRKSGTTVIANEHLNVNARTPSSPSALSDVFIHVSAVLNLITSLYFMN